MRCFVHLHICETNPYHTCAPLPVLHDVQAYIPPLASGCAHFCVAADTACDIKGRAPCCCFNYKEQAKGIKRRTSRAGFQGQGGHQAQDIKGRHPAAASTARNRCRR
eukprot:372692-Pelagomonas_calceolata.AAC.7